MSVTNEMSHGLTIAELLKAARVAVERCNAGGIAAKDGPRATGYLAGVEAAAECIFDISLTDHSDKMIEEHLKRITDLVDQDKVRGH